MATIKEAALESIKNLPDDCSADVIMDKIYFISQVLEGLKDAEQGKLITTEQLLERVTQWAK